jgi:hypothetical protein
MPGSTFPRRTTWSRVAIVTLVAATLAAGTSRRPARADEAEPSPANRVVAPAAALAPDGAVTPAPDLRAAIRQIEKRGYRSEPADTYSFSAWLRGVLGKQRPGAVQGADNRSVYDARGFLFDSDHFRGRDSLTPRAGLRVAWQSDGTLAMQYALYQTGDAICCPTGGKTVGRLRIDEGPPPPEAIPTNDANATARR